ncbi:5590_t:CDS:10 [Paraglomus occultum]|uniref:5590_t:CDS:1 n=1 Tax=Paraglomus occultum TaxID=144539 RepID=A0A9N8ZS53_9GLOM|nr:5590_t:CDS:10 [Paraglomus occultum]
MPLQVLNPNNVKIYTINGSGSRSVPDWLARRKKKALNNDPEWRTRIELIQDFEFPEASIKVKTTRDGRFCMATGVYKPQIRVFEYSEVSMKFDRHTDSENITFEILSDDWTKSVHLQTDRTIEFHAQGGIHYKTRIPKFGRDMAYHYPTCDLLISASSSQIYRLNLTQGRFLSPFDTTSVGNNVVSINPAHQLYAFGSDNGLMEFWDPRSRSRIGIMSVHVADCSITAFEYRNDGLSFGVGTSTGHVLLYDLRSSRPWLIKDHQYGYPIKRIHWFEGEADGKVGSADCKIIKIWNKENGSAYTAIEPLTDINDFCVIPESGLIFVANEGIQIGAYYVPSLGPAPRWCSFLDNLTEELEENTTPTVYENYKFITRKELISLGLDGQVGTNILRPYMHGFFIDLRLYEKARAIANPFLYEEYRERTLREKLEKARESRIRATKKLPKVNKELASRLLEAKTKKSNGVKPTNTALEDPRFLELFTNPEYQVDENDEEFKKLHPNVSRKRKDSDEEDEGEVNDAQETDSEPSGSSSLMSSSSDSDEDDKDESPIIKQSETLKKQRQTQKPRQKQTQAQQPPQKRRAIQMTELTTDEAVSLYKPNETSTKQADTAVDDDDSIHQISGSPTGDMEMSFKIYSKNGKRGKKNRPNSSDDKNETNRERRSASKNTIRDLIQ